VLVALSKRGLAIMQKITPYLWFDNNAEEAINFYVSIFKDSKIIRMSRMGPDEPIFWATFQLEGQPFYALNGGPKYKLTEAFSLFVDCKTQEEVDYLWGRLLEDGGEEQMCGWLKDRYGLSWQIIPSVLMELMEDKDPVKANNVMQAMLKMRKIDIRALQKAYEAA
jgi:predicted 3-demethylubiquinone-9 3-methyltransferase (glyoxalase superfamily)